MFGIRFRNHLDPRRTAAAGRLSGRKRRKDYLSAAAQCEGEQYRVVDRIERVARAFANDKSVSRGPRTGVQELSRVRWTPETGVRWCWPTRWGSSRTLHAGTTMASARGGVLSRPVPSGFLRIAGVARARPAPMHDPPHAKHSRSMPRSASSLEQAMTDIFIGATQQTAGAMGRTRSGRTPGLHGAGACLLRP